MATLSLKLLICWEDGLFGKDGVIVIAFSLEDFCIMRLPLTAFAVFLAAFSSGCSDDEKPSRTFLHHDLHRSFIDRAEGVGFSGSFQRNPELLGLLAKEHTAQIGVDGLLDRENEFKKGEMVRIGDPILWLADLTSLRVRSNIDQVDLGRVRAGQRMRVASNAYPDRSWTARVSELVPHVIVRDNRSVAEGLALVDPPTDGLVPGMNVDVDIIVEDVRDALQVPAAAVYTENGQPFVYRIAKGYALWTPVTLGRSSVGAVEILGGLEAKDRVVVGSSNGLRDGSRVEARMPNVAAR